MNLFGHSPRNRAATCVALRRPSFMSNRLPLALLFAAVMLMMASFATPAAHAGPKKYWVETFANATGYPSAGCDAEHLSRSCVRQGRLNAGRNYVFCKTWGVRVGSSTAYNQWWLLTDLDVVSPGASGRAFVSAYYLKRWGNNVAKDVAGTTIPTCGAKSPPPAPPPPAGAPTANKAIAWAIGHTSWWAGMYSQTYRLPSNLSVAQMQTQAPPRGGRQGCDCSSFVLWAMAQGGVFAGTFTGDIWTAHGLLPFTKTSTSAVSSSNGLVTRGYGTTPPGGYKPGDLVFYGVSTLDRPAGQGHVALYTGDGKIVQCSGGAGSNAGKSINSNGAVTSWIRFQRVVG